MSPGSSVLPGSDAPRHQRLRTCPVGAFFLAAVCICLIPFSCAPSQTPENPKEQFQELLARVRDNPYDVLSQVAAPSPHFDALPRGRGGYELRVAHAGDETPLVLVHATLRETRPGLSGQYGYSYVLDASGELVAEFEDSEPSLDEFGDINGDGLVEKVAIERLAYYTPERAGEEPKPNVLRVYQFEDRGMRTLLELRLSWAVGVLVPYGLRDENLDGVQDLWIDLEPLNRSYFVWNAHRRSWKGYAGGPTWPWEMTVGIPVDAYQDMIPGMWRVWTPADGESRSSGKYSLTELLSKLRSPKHAERAYAAQELGRLGDPAAVDGLMEALAHDSSDAVRKAAARALEQIGGGFVNRCVNGS